MGKAPSEWALPGAAASGATVHHPCPTFRAPVNGHFEGPSLKLWQELTTHAHDSNSSDLLQPQIFCGGRWGTTHEHRWFALLTCFC